MKFVFAILFIAIGIETYAQDSIRFDRFKGRTTHFDRVPDSLLSIGDTVILYRKKVKKGKSVRPNVKFDRDGTYLGIKQVSFCRRTGFKKYTTYLQLQLRPKGTWEFRNGELRISEGSSIVVLKCIGYDKKKMRLIRVT